MAPKLYKMDTMAPCRFVYLTAEALGIELDYLEVDLRKNDQLTPSFLKVSTEYPKLL